MPSSNSTQLLKSLPDTVDPATITLSPSPNGADSKLLTEIFKFKIGQIGLG
jgi:nuclear protein localization protein 4 homolog